ncbi:MAG: response regulator transcription factor [Cyanobacteria bacterium HKST-UBA05]|nr:response regulator transcription factor [Cyanobacteria bacterium HKST-UBA05]
MVIEDKSASVATIRVLIVEDSSVVRLGIRKILENFGGVSVVAERETGEEGLKLYEAHEPDVVLMDISLPGISGLECTKAILEQWPDAKIVVLTSSQEEDLVYEAVQCGANSFCTKNVDAETLYHVLKSSVEGGAWFDPSVATNVLSKLKSSGGQAKPSEEMEYYLNKLTDRETVALKLLTEGRNNNEIAQEMFISVHTAKVYVTNIISKLEVESRTQAALKALKLGMVRQ